MSKVRGRRKTKAQTALGSISETVQEQTVRKSLSILQPAADNPASLVGCGGTPTSRKGEKLKPIIESKENSPMKPRRSKRKTAVQSSEESKVTSSTPVNSGATTEDNDGLKQQTLTKYTKKPVSKLQESTLHKEEDKKEVLGHPEASLSGISIPSESSGYFSDCAEKHDGSFKSGVTDESKSAENAHNEDLEDLITAQCKGPQGSPPIPKDVHDLLVSDTVPESYWKELAEQRRLALEETLHENELLRDQLEVLETEYSKLKQIVDDAKDLTEIVKGMLD